MLEKVADSARKAVKLAEPCKPYGGQFLEFCSIPLSTYQTCMKLTRKSTEFCQFFCPMDTLVVHTVLVWYWYGGTHVFGTCTYGHSVQVRKRHNFPNFEPPESSHDFALIIPRSSLLGIFRGVLNLLVGKIRDTSIIRET